MSKTIQTTFYLCAMHPFFAVRTELKRHKFENHVLKLTNDEERAALDALIADFPAIGCKIKEVSAEKAADAESVFLGNVEGGAVKGAFNSDNSPAAKTPMRETNAAFKDLPLKDGLKTVKEAEKDSKPAPVQKK